MSKARLEAFTDAIIAIIMTLLILELDSPEHPTFAALWAKRYGFFIYLVSFLSLAVYWNNHHHLLQIADKISGKVMWLNIFFILGLSFYPFASSWIEKGVFARAPELFYGVVVLFTNVCYALMARQLVRVNGSESRVGRAIKGYHKPLITIAMNIVGLILALFVPIAVIILYVLSMLLWVIPEKKIESQFT